MIIIFDLDDTLYPELTYVHSGFRAVAKASAERHGVSEEWAFELLLSSLRQHGRGQQFDDLARAINAPPRKSVAWMLKTYRHHEPKINLPVNSDRVLHRCARQPLYLVTDGHKVVQAKKVSALGLWDRFEHCYLTNRYGVRCQKPSTRVFELILKRAQARAEDAVYIGDNPKKDFCGIRPLGFRTVRIRQGAHKKLVVPPEQDAERCIDELSELIPVLAEWGCHLTNGVTAPSAGEAAALRRRPPCA